MAITFEAVISGTTYNLNDGNPYSLLSIEGMGGAPVVRLGQRSPQQNSVTDLGYRLQPRVITLAFGFYATTDALLDTYRQNLLGIFRPTTDIPVELRVTRDDGTVRKLDCYAVGDIEISLVPEHRPGHYHQATVRLRAADPAWKAASSTNYTFAGTAIGDWWTAGTVIGTANVMEHTEYPTQGQAWTYTGFITGAWTVVFRSGQETGSGTKTAFRVGTASNLNDPKWWWYGGTSWAYDATNNGLTTLPAGTQNYMLVQDPANANSRSLYYGGTSVYLQTFGDWDISNTARAWRAAPGSATATRWTEEMPMVAVYDKALTESERVALNAFMDGTAILGTVTAINSGDFPEYPYVTIRGPIVNPVLTNVTTGVALDLQGISVGSADTYFVDLTDGNKTITSINGNNAMSAISNAVGLARWNLAPAPIASGGTNIIRVQGGSTSANTEIGILFHHHYASF